MQNGRTIRIDGPGLNLAAVVHLPRKTPAPVIVCCHGLLSLKDSPKYVAIGVQMSAAGFCVLRFDFSGCGHSPARDEPLVPARMRDLETVIAFALSEQWSDGRVGLLGSSLGGYLSLLAADADPDRIAAVVAWAAPFDLVQVRAEESGMDAVRRNFPGPGRLRLGDPKNLESLGAAQRVLLLHGRQDDLVGWEHAVQIYRHLKDPRELVLFRTADHRFVDQSWRNAAIRISLEWFLRFLTIRRDSL